MNSETQTIDIIFDGPPGAESGRFIEVEDHAGGLRIGEWIERDEGSWALRMPIPWDVYQDAFSARARNA